MRSFFLLGALTLVASTAAAQGADGKVLYEQHCRKCHGATGKPSAAMKRLLPELPVWDASFFGQRSDDQIVQVIMTGKGKNMKPLRDVLKPEEMVAVAKYIRTLAP